jgi:murein DD-endopeptidase MepM/ murein hydrolase activator NlpD
MNTALLVVTFLLLLAAPGTTVRAEEDETYVAPFQWPLDGRFLQGYSGYHRGIDIGAAHGTAVGAAAAGWVSEVSWQSGYGLYAVVDHGDGVSSLYSHLSGAGVAYGQSLNPGDLVGWVGMTGWATTPHLHFEVHVNGSRTNPFGYLP